MPDLTDLLSRTTPTDLGPPDLGGLARRARRRRTRRRAALATPAVVAAVGLALRVTGDTGDTGGTGGDVVATSLGRGETRSIAAAQAAQALDEGAGQARLLVDEPVVVVLSADVTDEERASLAAWLAADPRVASVEDTAVDGRAAFRVHLVDGTTEDDIWRLTDDTQTHAGVEVINLAVELTTP